MQTYHRLPPSYQLQHLPFYTKLICEEGVRVGLEEVDDPHIRKSWLKIQQMFKTISQHRVSINTQSSHFSPLNNRSLMRIFSDLLA